MLDVIKEQVHRQCTHMINLIHTSGLGERFANKVRLTAQILASARNSETKRCRCYVEVKAMTPSWPVYICNNWNDACGNESGRVMNILKFMYSVGVMTKLRKISASYCSESVRNKRPSTLLTYEGFLKTSFFLQGMTYQWVENPYQLMKEVVA